MKGVIVTCVEQLVTTRFGRDKWEAVLDKVGMKRDTVFMATSDYDDAAVLAVVGAIREVLGLDLQQVADAFGDFWVNEFAPRMYKLYFAGAKNAREFLLNMTAVHEKTTRAVVNAKPPVFTYEWKGPSTLVMGYSSHRDLIEFVAGLARGVGRYYGEKLDVSILDRKSIRVVFG